tara:strand:+ start:257 stop:901 length:645 start_codon:yes stop_codon:yes gene_type:complete
MSYKVIENFFNSSLYNELKNFFLSDDSLWILNRKIVGNNTCELFSKQSKIDIDEKIIDHEIYYKKNNMKFNKYYDYQFVCPLYNINDSKNICNNIMRDKLNKIINSNELINLNISKILRIKTNIAPYCGIELSNHNLHTDIIIDRYPNENREKFKTLIIYFNTCNGYTIIKKYDKKIYSKDNRAVIFNTYLEHAGTNTTNDKYRLVLNINYIEK